MARVEVVVDSVRRGTLKNSWTVILKEKTAERFLPIYIGPQQANIIKKLLIGVGRIDPAEFDLSSAGIDTIFCKVEAVMINRFANNVFYAKLLLTRDDNEAVEVDCAPAKAVAHGIRAEVPIFVEEAVLSKAAIAVKA